jgi:DNA modification methylase
MKPYFEFGGISIYHGDSREILPKLGRFDLLLTDPPYGIGIASNPIRQAHEKKDWDDAVVEPTLLESCIGKAKEAIVWGGNYFALPAHQRFLAWDKRQPEDFSTSMIEIAWTNLDGPAKMFRYSVTSYMKEHPTEKPLPLMKWCLSFAPNAKSVIDPFMGSGTTLRAAKDAGLTAVGIEREEKYCEIAAKRMAQEVMEFV